MGEEGLTQAAACLGALHDLGRSGLGPQRGSARLCELAQVLPDGRWLPLAGARSRFESVTAADLWDAGRTLLQQRDAAPAGLTVELLTPLRLRRNGQDLREPPTLEELWRRFSRRLVTLLPPNLPGGVFGDQEHPQWCDWARGCALEDCRTQRVHWERWSARQQRAMPFEGLLGSLQYAAPAAQALPWLHLAHWLQLGAKTTFGLGVLRALT
jgi:CRISPR/Cas system endoribonuclease Cas6 (RAMP superfamily)